jgi:Asp-tRNA(Asn)/Glu-tRNA(Gln) amidotransferase A subunit family amidase
MFMKTIIDAKPWLKEPSLLPFPWNEGDAFKGRKPKIAVLMDDGVVKPHPPVTLALKQVVEKLKANGNVEIVEWIPYKHDEAWAIIVQPPLHLTMDITDFWQANLYFCDGGAEDFAAMEEADEPELPLTTHILRNEHVQTHTIPSMWSAVQKRDAYRMAYARHWNSTASSTGPHGELEGVVDAILCPVGPGAAPKIDTSKWWGYTSQWNLLDYPAVVFPVDRVDPAKYSDAEKYTPRNERDRYNWDLWEHHGAEGYKNAPVSLQLVGRR